MALSNLTLLDAAQFTPRLKAYSAKVKAEFLQIIDRLNVVKDLAETNEAAITAAEGDITTLQGQMTTAQADIDAAEAEIDAMIGHRAPFDVLDYITNANLEIGGAATTDYSLIVFRATGRELTFADPSTLENGRTWRIYNATTSSIRVNATNAVRPDPAADFLLVDGEELVASVVTISIVGVPTNQWLLSGAAANVGAGV